jgi:3'(2'), 5'-bisphosphate nucleotidase
MLDNNNIKIALEACVKASNAIMDIYSKDFESFTKDDGSPLTKADLASTKIIHKHLDPLGIPITGEESKKFSYNERKTWKNCWCIYPLDGTKEFIKKNGEFAINIAYIENQQSVFGIIASPVQKKILFGGRLFGVYECRFKDIDQSEKWCKITSVPKSDKLLNLIGSRSHGTGPLDLLINDLKYHFEQINFKSKGSSLKFFDLAKGEADIYPRFAPTMEWDIAAGQAIIEALGGEIINQQNQKPLVYNKENLFNPFFVVKTKALLEAMA